MFFTMILIVLCNAVSSAASWQRFEQVKSWAFQTEAIKLDQLKEGIFDLVIINPYIRNSEGDIIWVKKKTIKELKESNKNYKIILAYMEIGEAKEESFYWKDGFEENPPSWLGPQSLKKRGVFNVKFWQSGWQKVLFGSDESFLNKILQAGFDGVCLGAVEGFRFWEEDKDMWSSRLKMIELVSKLSKYAKKKNPDFIIIAENAEDLSVNPTFFEAVDGILREGIFFGYEKEDIETKPDISERIIKDLTIFILGKKPIFTIDYCSDLWKIKEVYKKAKQKGYIPYVTKKRVYKRLLKDTSPPQITVLQPFDGQQVYTPFVNVIGEVYDDRIITEITVNGIKAELFDNNFEVLNVPLKEGSNQITITAYDGERNKTTKHITVFFKPEPPIK
jgi:cysteinyl-tRNA synthetase